MLFWSYYSWLSIKLIKLSKSRLQLPITEISGLEPVSKNSRFVRFSFFANKILLPILECPSRGK
ncbi:hypothetical protein F92_04825 [Francisella tularensis subsp. holarctica F92]|nr:hypothetical protein F92_04825 [Francisella tularensis subsp. holarctica F92]